MLVLAKIFGSDLILIEGGVFQNYTNAYGRFRGSGDLCLTGLSRLYTVQG